MAYANAIEARAAGWFSRLFKSSETHSRASETNKLRWVKKQENARARWVKSRKLSMAQKLANLPKTGAVRERAKLTTRLSAETEAAKAAFKAASKPKLPKVGK